jgi:hypothetical protein
MACINSSYSALRNNPFYGYEALLANIQPNDYNLHTSRLASLANIQQDPEMPETIKRPSSAHARYEY